MEEKTIKINLNEKGEPVLPPNWTFLIHGTDTSQWDKKNLNSNSFIVKGIEAGLYCVEKDNAIENQKTGINVSKIHSNLKQQEGEKNFEIRCLIYKDLRRQQDREKMADKLTEGEIKDINNFHIKKPYYPSIPNKTKLIKVATTEFDEITKEKKEIIWYIPEQYIKHYIEDSGFKKEIAKQQTIIINGQSVEVKTEKCSDFDKTTRSLNGVEINSSKEYEDGSYDKKSRVFVADKGIKVSNNYINYTTYRQEYDAKTNIYTEKAQSPVIDNNGNIIGEQENIEVYSTENGRKEIATFSTMENEEGNYHLEANSIGNGDKYKETSTLMIDNKLSSNKEKIQYINDDGKESYMYMENGVIGQKITKTDRGTTIDIYKDGKPDVTYEYDENGKAIIQMAGIEQLEDNYVKKCFDIAMPDYEVVTHQEPEEIYLIDEMEKEQKFKETEASTQKLGKETVDIQKDAKKIDEVENQMKEQLKEKTAKKEKPQTEQDFGK